MRTIEVETVLLRFSHLGMAAVCAIATTGVANTWRMLGTALPELMTAYGRVLRANIALMVNMRKSQSCNAARGWAPCDGAVATSASLEEPLPRREVGSVARYGRGRRWGRGPLLRRPREGNSGRRRSQSDRCHLLTFRQAPAQPTAQAPRSPQEEECHRTLIEASSMPVRTSFGSPPRHPRPTESDAR